MNKKIMRELGAIDLSERFSQISRYKVPTGIRSLDLITEGGIYSGKLTEISGSWSTGKSRILCHIIANAQKMGGLAVYVDVERSLEKGLVSLTGVDVDNLIYPDPNEVSTVEDIFELLHKSITILREVNPEGLLLFAWDSLAATGTRESMDLEKDNVGQATGAARRAKVVGDGLAKYMPLVYKNNVAFIIINQLRDRLDVMYGDPTETPGGKAVKFWASLRLKITASGSIKDKMSGEKVGHDVKVTCDKSKQGVPFRYASFPMLVSEPIGEFAGLLDYMVRHGEIVKPSPGWYQFPGSAEKFREDEFEQIMLNRERGVSK